MGGLVGPTWVVKLETDKHDISATCVFCVVLYLFLLHLLLCLQNLQCGESVTIEGQAYTISAVTHRYQLRKGRYEPSERRLDVLSTGRYILNLYLENLLQQSWHSTISEYDAFYFGHFPIICCIFIMICTIMSMYREKKDWNEMWSRACIILCG